MCYFIPDTNGRLPKINEFNILNLHFHGLEVHKAEFKYSIDLIFSSHKITNCGMKFYESFADVTGTVINIETEGCIQPLAAYNTLDHLVPFTPKFTIISSNPINKAPFLQRKITSQLSTHLLEYLFKTNSGYCTLNPMRHLDFIEALYGPEHLLFYCEFNFTVKNDNILLGDSIQPSSNYSRADTIEMKFTKVSGSRPKYKLSLCIFYQ